MASIEIGLGSNSAHKKPGRVRAYLRLLRRLQYRWRLFARTQKELRNPRLLDEVNANEALKRERS